MADWRGSRAIASCHNMSGTERPIGAISCKACFRPNALSPAEVCALTTDCKADILFEAAFMSRIFSVATEASSTPLGELGSFHTKCSIDFCDNIVSNLFMMALTLCKETALNVAASPAIVSTCPTSTKTSSTAALSCSRLTC